MDGWMYGWMDGSISCSKISCKSQKQYGSSVGGILIDAILRDCLVKSKIVKIGAGESRPTNLIFSK
jgi:hypothetical protein